MSLIRLILYFTWQVSFPKRFYQARSIRLPGNQIHRGGPGVSDSVVISSRNGKVWMRQFQQAWLRPGRDIENWTERSNMVAAGIRATNSGKEGYGWGEWNLYVLSHYHWPSMLPGASLLHCPLD